MTFVSTKSLNEYQQDQIHHLWNEAYPLKLQDRFSTLLNESSNHEHFLLEDDAGKIIGWAALFDNNSERRFSIIVSQNFSGKGLGKILLEALKNSCDLFYGWVIDHNNDVKQNGEVYRSPLDFYLKNGFEIVPDCRLETKLISALKVRWKKPTLI